MRVGPWCWLFVLASAGCSEPARVSEPRSPAAGAPVTAALAQGGPATAVRPGARLQPNVATTEELLQRLAPRLSRSPHDVRRTEHGRGRVSYELQAGLGHALLALPGADGHSELVCVDSPAAAERALRAHERGARRP